MAPEISDKVLASIKEKKLHPKARKFFVAKNIAFYLAAAISVIVGAITVAAMLFILFNQEWDLLKRAGGILKVLISVLPYFWLVVFVLFMVIGYYEVRHIEGGYKIRLAIIAGAYILASGVFGAGLYVLGVGEFVEEYFVERTPFYHKVIEGRYKVWHQPEEGLVMGKVIAVDDDVVTILDFEGTERLIDFSEVSHAPKMLKPGMHIHVLGEYEDGMFEAETVRPHKLPFKGMQHERKQPPHAY